MSDITAVTQDWRFAAATVLLGAVIGKAIYLKIPSPPGVAAAKFRMRRAGLAGLAATAVGRDDLQLVAGAVGIDAIAQIAKLLTRQRHRCLGAGIVLAAILVAVIFRSLPYSTLPDWAFVAAGCAGLYQAWKLW